MSSGLQGRLKEVSFCIPTRIDNPYKNYNSVRWISLIVSTLPIKAKLEKWMWKTQFYASQAPTTKKWPWPPNTISMALDLCSSVATTYAFNSTSNNGGNRDIELWCVTHSPDQQEAWKESDGDEVEDGREDSLHWRDDEAAMYHKLTQSCRAFVTDNIIYHSSNQHSIIHAGNSAISRWPLK